MMLTTIRLLFLLPVALAIVPASAVARLPDPATPAGYVAHLLVNEVPFPGERGYRSEQDSAAAMEQLLHVLDRRLARIPEPYTQPQIAATRADDLIGIITAGGEKGQFDGFFRDAQGRPAMVPRVTERIDNLNRIASQGKPGTFARLLNHAGDLANAYLAEQQRPSDRHAAVAKAERQPATGGGYSWMTDEVRYHPGGNFLRIDDADSGSLGGNRFFTLRKEPR